MSGIDAGAVLALARAQRHDWVDEAAARTIATGATAAVAAVAASVAALGPGLVADDAAGFLATLEALAEPDA